jgi:hypothetical protein
MGSAGAGGIHSENLIPEARFNGTWTHDFILFLENSRTLALSLQNKMTADQRTKRPT